MTIDHKALFMSLRRVWVPIVYGSESSAAYQAAYGLAESVTLVGIVRLAAAAPLSSGASQAREIRRRIRDLAGADAGRARGAVIVSHQPWAELVKLIQAETPDLLVLNWAHDPQALGVTVADILAWPPCDVALVRGPLAGGDFPVHPRQLLVPMRGGLYAELSLRLGLKFRPAHLTALHLRLAGDTSSEAPYAGLERVLARLPDVETRALTTADVARTLLEEARHSDLVIMGAAGRAPNPSTTLGPVGDRVLKETPAAVMVVKTRRPMPEALNDELVGTGAISILVDKWFAENTFHADEFADLRSWWPSSRLRG